MPFAQPLKLRPRADGDPLEAPPAAQPASKSREGLVAAVEGDIAFSMRVIARETDRAAVQIDESRDFADRLKDAGAALARQAAAASGRGGFTSFARQVGSDARACAERVDALGREAALLSPALAEADGRAAKIAEGAARASSLAGALRASARQVKFLALNAGIEASRADSAGPGMVSLAKEMIAASKAMQTAAGELSARAEELRTLADGNLRTIRDFARVRDRAAPSLARIARRQGAQAALAAAARAEGEAEAEAFAGLVRQIESLDDLAASARRSARAASATGGNLLAMVERHAGRAVFALRGGREGDRRRAFRAPVRIPGSITVRGETVAAAALDIAPDGALITCDKPLAAGNERSVLTLGPLGECSGRVVATSEAGLHYRFHRPSEDFAERTRRLIESVNEADEPFVASAREGAAAIEGAFARALDDGAVDAGALVADDYRAIPGTNPLQYETGALAYYEKALPPILVPYWEADPAPVFAVASDRNAYLPVHHPRYSQPQRAGDPAWNDLFSRNRRIMARPQSLAMSRNMDASFVKVFMRQNDSGANVPIKVYCAPIFIGGALWGNFALGYFF